jgi:hypothetical protein
MIVGKKSERKRIVQRCSIRHLAIIATHRLSPFSAKLRSTSLLLTASEAIASDGGIVIPAKASKLLIEKLQRGLTNR